MQLIVLAKQPVPGRVKTRLCPPFSHDEAASLAAAALADTLDAALRCSADEVIVVLDGEPGDWLPAGVRVVAQHGDGLDDRLANAWDDCGGPALQIGMDTPQLTPALLDEALSAMADGSTVLGLADDGGWWAIGLHRPDRAVFEGVPMSAWDTGARQHQRLLDTGHRVRMLPTLRDVDTAADVSDVAAQIPDSRFAHTAAQLGGGSAAPSSGSAANERRTLVFGLVEDPSAVSVVAAIAARVQLTERFEQGFVPADTWARVPHWEHRLLVHNLVVHLRPGATARLEGLADPEHAFACGLEPIGESDPHLYRRTERTTIHDLVAEARSGLRRVEPDELAANLERDPTEWLVLDTRTPTDRERFGVIPGSLHMPRTTLEWMADPASGYSHEQIVGFGQHLVCVCNEGYSSSLSAASLQRLGFVNATDLVGGVLGWRAVGLPVEQPDHTRFN
jgi:uncharacterized protein